MPQLEHTIYMQITEEELINTLKGSANGNQREGFIRVTFTEGDYSGGNDAPCTFDLMMAESTGDPFHNESTKQSPTVGGESLHKMNKTPEN